MSYSNLIRLGALCLALGLTACGGPADTDSAANSVSTPTPATQHKEPEMTTTNHLQPLPGKEDAVPEITKKWTVDMQTTAGDIKIEVYPEAAPNAANRFIELVEAGFYDDTPISRVVPGFVAQFGVNWREPQKEWKDRNFEDDPTYFAFERGTLAFAKAGPNTNSTQVFINYAENNRLASPEYNFSVFGVVVEGMDVVDSFVQVGDPSGGLDQARLWNNGDTYLESLSVKPTMIESAAVL